MIVDPRQYRAVRDRCRVLAPDLFFAGHLLGKPRRFAAFVTIAVAGQLSEIVHGGAGEEASAGCSTAARGAGCSACGGESPEQRRAVCSAVLDHLYAGQPTGKPELDAFPAVAAARGLPRQSFERLCDGWLAAGKLRRYPTWNRLRRVCNETAGVASAIALRVLSDAPPAENGALEAQAAAFGVAVRMTEILCGVERDWDAGRLLLPLDDLVKYGLCERDIAAFSAAGASGGLGAGGDPRWRALMAFEAERTRRLFEGGLAGAAALPRDSRRAAAVLAQTCLARLDRLEAAGFDPFTARIESDWKTHLRSLPVAVRLLARRAGR